ncbi:MAG TPA: nucleotide exchange factor GrpE [Solirubrobacterales bacterium]|nr:nucleotide exchange factor GrpE [Solirubrobacterales bacterium]
MSQDKAERPAGPVAGDGASSSQAAGEPPSPTPPAGEAIEKDLDALISERDEYLDLAKRTKADFENFRKRMSAEVTAASVRGKAALVGELVHVIDNLERALDAAGIDPDDGSTPEEPLAHGVVLTYRDLCQALKGNGVESLDPTGERFDPNLHEALSTMAADGAESGTVVEVAQKGYRLGEQLIRPARVVVAE